MVCEEEGHGQLIIRLYKPDGQLTGVWVEGHFESTLEPHAQLLVWSELFNRHGIFDADTKSPSAPKDDETTMSKARVIHVLIRLESPPLETYAKDSYSLHLGIHIAGMPGMAYLGRILWPQESYTPEFNDSPNR